MKFFQNIWYGRVGLAKVFWIYDILFGLIAGIILIPVLNIVFRGELSISFSTVLSILVIRVFAFYGLVVAVGVWKSSNFYTGHVIWPLLAKLHSVLSAALIISSLITSLQGVWDVAICAILMLIAMVILSESNDENTPNQNRDVKNLVNEEGEHTFQSKNFFEQNWGELAINADDLLGTDDWNLAVKYDPALLQAFSDIYKISPDYARRFKDTISKEKLFHDFAGTKNAILKQAFGLNSQSKFYFANDLLNKIIESLLVENSLAAAEFIKLVGLYNLESNADSGEGVAKIFEWLNKVESTYKISVKDKLILEDDMTPESNGFQIKHKLYSRYENLGYVCYKLYNGNCAIVRRSEYRIYDSTNSANDALTHFSKSDQWTTKNLVDRLDIDDDQRDSVFTRRLEDNEIEPPKSLGLSIKNTIDVIFNNLKFIIMSVDRLTNFGIFLFFIIILIITVFYEFGPFPTFLALVIFGGLIGGYYFFKGQNK